MAVDVALGSGVGVRTVDGLGAGADDDGVQMGELVGVGRGVGAEPVGSGAGVTEVGATGPQLATISAAASANQPRERSATELRSVTSHPVDATRPASALTTGTGTVVGHEDPQPVGLIGIRRHRRRLAPR